MFKRYIDSAMIVIILWILWEQTHVRQSSNFNVFHCIFPLYCSCIVFFPLYCIFIFFHCTIFCAICIVSFLFYFSVVLSFYCVILYRFISIVFFHCTVFLLCYIISFPIVFFHCTVFLLCYIISFHLHCIFCAKMCRFIVIICINLYQFFLISSGI